MAYYIPEGSKFYYSVTFASAKTISAMTNANPVSCASTSHGYVDGDEVLLTSGWEDATDTVWRVDQTDTNNFTIPKLNTSNTSFFSANGGDGSTAQKLSTWVEIPQILTATSSGGDLRTTSVNPLSRRNGIIIPTGFNPVILTLSMGHDASNATYQAMLDISRATTKVAIKASISGGAVIYGYGHMSVADMPSLNVNQVNAVNCGISFLGRIVSY